MRMGPWWSCFTPRATSAPFGGTPPPVPSRVKWPRSAAPPSPVPPRFTLPSIAPPVPSRVKWSSITAPPVVASPVALLGVAALPAVSMLVPST